jgi:RNA polymerase sigma-70 factor (ECF subfamily)
MTRLPADDRGKGGTPIPSVYSGAADEELLRWSTEGNTKAFDAIVVRHGPFALRVARRLIPDRVQAQDVVQEAMLRAWDQAAQFDPGRARFTTWLYRIVVNLCIDHQRRTRSKSLPDGFDPADPAPGVTESVEADQTWRAVVAALNDLPTRQRAAGTLVYDEGLSGAETARVLGVSVKAVERLLARARDLLRERLRRDLGIPEGDKP